MAGSPTTSANVDRQGDRGGATDAFRTELNAQREADRVAVHQFAPPSVLINTELQILQFRGATSAYLAPPLQARLKVSALRDQGALAAEALT